MDLMNHLMLPQILAVYSFGT